jgi:SPP1 gp7 family putative phage head morphogenesis protein
MHGTFRAVEIKPTRERRKDIELRPLRPNAGLEAAYIEKLDRLVREMQKSVAYWILSTYRNNEPIIAMDDILPANALKRAIAELTKRWQKQFDQAAPALAKWFSIAAHKRSDAQLRAILRKGGFSVKFQMTPAMRDVLKATIEQNISLIKSIPEQYLKNVQGHVMRSVQAGRDLGTLTKALHKNYGVTQRRAAFIARSQNNLATGAMNKARQQELGITKAKWRHSKAGKHKRPTHVANDGKLYDVAKGWYDPDVKRWIFPGELPNCRCSSISVIPGFS